MNPSASARYARENDWLVMRGRGRGRIVRGDMWGAQFRGHAEMLISDRTLHYYGPSHCSGDRFVSEIRGSVSRKGNLTDWRRMGMVHHISLTTEQIAVQQYVVITEGASVPLALTG